MKIIPNNRFQRTSHKVRRPLNRDVRLRRKMKFFIIWYVTVALAIVAGGATNSVDTGLPPCPKGYCLYGYIASNRVVFVLMPGTDRTKTFEEIDNNSSFVSSSWFHLKVDGLNAGKELLLRVPQEYPDNLFIDGIRASGGIDKTTIPPSVTDALQDDISLLKKIRAGQIAEAKKDFINIQKQIKANQRRQRQQADEQYKVFHWRQPAPPSP